MDHSAHVHAARAAGVAGSATPGGMAPYDSNSPMWDQIFQGDAAVFSPLAQSGAKNLSDNDTSARQLPPSPRCPKISQPTEPRPFLDIPRPTPLSSSRFVLSGLLRIGSSFFSGPTPIFP
jgi:hypothetical protein